MPDASQAPRRPRLRRRLSRLVGYGTAGAIVAIALAVSLLRLLLPALPGYQDELQARVGELIDARVRVERFNARWRGLSPELLLEGVSLIDPATNLPFLRFREASLRLSAAGVLRGGPKAGVDILLRGGALKLLRDGDGRLRLAGPPRAEGRADGEAATTWLLTSGRLVLADTLVELEDHSGGTPRTYRFEDVDLALANRGEDHRLRARLDLPGSLGTRGELAMRFRGPADRPERWRGELYVELDTVLLTGLSPLLGDDLPIRGGRLDGRLWARWSDERLQAMHARLAGEDLVLSMGPGQGTQTVERLAGRIDLRRAGDGWRVELRGLESGIEGRAAVPVDASVALARDRAAGTVRAHGRVTRLQVEDWLPWLRLAEIETAQGGEEPWLSRLRPGGELVSARFEYRGPWFSLEHLALVSRFRDLGLQSVVAGVPSVAGLDGVVALDGGEALLQLATEDAGADFRGLFREPIALDSLEGELRLRIGPGRLALSSGDLALSNPDLSGRARLAMSVPREGSPLLDLRAHVDQARAASTWRYLPVTEIDPDVVAWLDRALRDGTAQGADLLFHGRAADFPRFAASGAGRMEIRFAAQDLTLDYLEGWPPAALRAARVAFIDDAMVAEVDRAAVLGLETVRAQVAIPHLDEPVLRLSAQARGDAAEMLAFVRRSPLMGLIGEVVGDSVLTGPAALDLTLRVPLLARLGDPRVTAVLDLEGARLRSAERDLAFSDVKGRFRFTEQGVGAADVQARYFGAPVRVDIETPAGSRVPRTLIRLDGRLPFAMAARRIRSPLLERVTGESDWRFELAVTHGLAGREPHVALRAESDLEGVAVDLPAPLRKTADERRALALETDFHGEAMGPVHLRWGEDVHAVVVAALDQSGEVGLERGAVSFGRGRPALPLDRRWRLAGSLPELSLDAWQALLEETGAGTGNATARVAELDLEIGRLQVLGHSLGHTRLASAGPGSDLTVTLSSELARGRLTVPPPGEDRPVQGEFEHIRIPPGEGGGAAIAGDPRGWPALRLQADRVLLGERRLDDLRLVLVPVERGLRIDTLSLSAETLALRLEGDWLIAANGLQRSDFRLAAASEDLGTSLERLALVGGLEGGRLEAEAELGWNGPPAALDWEVVEGRASVRIEQGSFTQLDPKAGRLLGLFSIEALPRRLQLDFGDVFKEGFVFDRLEGAVTIGGAEVVTRDLTVAGRSARIELVGRTNVRDRTYDLLVTVTPKLGATLPVAGAIAGGTGVGAAVLVLQQLFKKPIERSIQIQYTVTGDWDEPVIERIGGPEETGEDAPGLHELD